VLELLENEDAVSIQIVQRSKPQLHVKFSADIMRAYQMCAEGRGEENVRLFLELTRIPAYYVIFISRW
jgi:hypothetical protein